MDDLPMMPTPINLSESERWRHTRLRRRMLDGLWEPDLKDRLQEHLGTTRREAWGALDMSSNPFRSICRALSCLYSRPPMVVHAESSADALIGQKGLIVQSGLWSAQQRFQSWVVGCREYLHRIDVDAKGDLNYRAVAPDVVHCTANPNRPDEPIKVCELRTRTRENGDVIWAWDVLDVSDDMDPVYKVLAAKGFYEGTAIDLTVEFLGQDMSGHNYPYRTKSGEPILPYQIYHADRLGDRLWDPYEMKETVEGSLNLAVGYSMWYHVLRDSSWPQRYIANGRISGLDISGGDSYRAEIVTDPATVLMLEPLDDGNQIMVGQWLAGGDVEKMESALQSFGMRLAQEAGLSPSDMQRASGNARSGYAISLTNAGKREVQSKFKPQFQWADQRLIARTAIMLNSVSGSNYPESGYEVIYRQVDLSPEEKRAQREDIFERLDRGFISMAQAKAELNPGISIEQAALELARIASMQTNK